MMTARPARYVCPPDCGAPPIGTPVETNPQFTSTDGDFTVSYPGRGTAYRSTFTGSGVVLDFTGGDTGTLELHGEPAGGRSPQQVLQQPLAADDGRGPVRVGRDRQDAPLSQQARAPVVGSGLCPACSAKVSKRG